MNNDSSDSKNEGFCNSSWTNTKIIITLSVTDNTVGKISFTVNQLITLCTNPVKPTKHTEIQSVFVHNWHFQQLCLKINYTVTNLRLCYIQGLYINFITNYFFKRKSCQHHAQLNKWENYPLLVFLSHLLNIFITTLHI